MRITIDRQIYRTADRCLVDAGDSVIPVDLGIPSFLIMKSKQEPRLHRRLRWMWGENLTCLSGVYLRRWGLETWFFSIRVHHWLHSDDDRAFHDHTWWFLSF